MANKKISELTLLDTVGANLQLTVIPVLDTASGTTRKVTLQQLNDSIEANIPFAAAAFTQANTANTNAITSGSYANAAFSRANNTLNVSTGGTVTGDLVITGNVSITGCTATLSVSTFRTADYIIDIGYGTVGAPSQNAGVRVLRGDENPVQLRWEESSNKWQYTNDGTVYIDFSDVTSSQLLSAYNQANTANVNAISSGSYANAAYIIANTANSNAANTDTKAASAGSYANAAFDTANTVTSASSYANSAYVAANTSDQRAVTSGAYANASFDRANSSNVLAQAAFDSSNNYTTSPSINTSITTTSTTFNLINSTATTVNFAGGATSALNIGASNAPITGFAATATTSSTVSSLGYLGVPQNSKSTNYTTVIGDSGKHIYVTSTATITIDSNANVAYPIGTTIGFIAGSSATVTISITGDTMYLGGTGTTGSRTLAAYGMATAVKVEETTWFISGNGLT